jgi:hypothetical protein
LIGATSAAETLTSYQDLHGMDSLMKLCECGDGGQQNRSLQAQPTANDLSTLQAWLRQLLGSLEAYIWLLESNIATPQQVFGACNLSKPQIFIASVEFIRREINNSDEHLANVLSLSEWEELEELKCKILICIVDLLYHVMENSDLMTLTKKAFTDLMAPLRCAEMWLMVCKLILKPATVGFSLKTHVFAKEMEDKLARFIYTMPQKLPSMVMELKSTLGNFMSHSHTDLGSLLNLKDIVRKGATSEQISYIKGICTLHDTGLAANLTKVI